MYFLEILFLGWVMDFHQFELLNFGVFDSSVKFPNISVTEPRRTSCYEIEIFSNDYDAIVHINDKSYKVEKGMLVCAKPDYKRYSKLHFACYFLHILPKNEKAHRLLNSLSDVVYAGDISEYIEILNKMIRYDFENEDIKNLYISGGISRILSLILKDCDIGDFETGVIGNKKALLMAEKFLRKNYKENITLDKLSEVANISPIYFHKLFTAYFHKSPNQYLLDIRISHAKTKLLREDYCLSEIALECGFSSQSYFCYKFKKSVGLTPLEYRKKELARIEI